LVGKPTGDALLKLAATELAGYDLIVERASDFDPMKMYFGRMLVADGRPRDDDGAIAVSTGDKD
jgi:hypothetical protein